MKYIFTILSILFLPILSFKVMKPKLCVNCKFFITDDVNTARRFFPNFDVLHFDIAKDYSIIKNALNDNS